VEDFSLAGEQHGNDRPLISVVVPVRNGMPWIEEQLSALSAQEAPGQCEVLVADNGSQDGTGACVENWSKQDPRVRLVDASARPGAGAARNIGARCARGLFLAFCDADDVVQPGWLAAVVDAFGEADLVAGVFDFTSLNDCGESDPIPAATSHLGFLPFALGANLAVRREAFEDEEGFRESLLTGEDVDLSWRLQLAGYRFAVAPDAVVAKRDRLAGRSAFRAAWGYGQGDLLLYRQFRSTGMRRDTRGAAKGWVWLIVTSPALVTPSGRRRWLRALGYRTGRLAGSVRHATFFP
jgi:GT2 family glycosyltransferase